MKQLLFIIIPLLIVISLAAVKSLDITTSELTEPLTSPTPSLPPTVAPPSNELTLDGRTYRYFYHKVDSEDSLLLIPNFESPQTSDHLMDTHRCSYGINGGFYRTDKLPLGLFYVNGRKYNSTSDSPTFNGYLSQTKDGRLYLSYTRSLDSSTLTDRLNSGYYTFILQSGPLFDLSAPVPAFSDPEYARRHLIAADSRGNHYIFSIFEKSLRYSGPRLQDLPAFFRHPQIQSITAFALVLNLDGGSASAYFDGQNKIKELTFIGSFLCGR